MRACVFSLALVFAPALSLAGDAGVAVASDAAVVDAGHTAPVAKVELPQAPEDLGGAVDSLATVVSLAKAGQWMAVVIVLLQLLVFGLKKWLPEEFMKKWGSSVVALVAGVAAMLGAVLGGLAWAEAVFVFVSGPLSSVVYDLLKSFGVIKKKADA